MARRRRNSTDTEQRKESYDYSRNNPNGSVGLSAKALEALDTGRYGQMNTRQAQYRTSQEQTQAAPKPVPALEGMTRSPEFSGRNSYVDTDRARAKYAERINYTPFTLETPQTSNDENYVVKRDRYDKLMQDSRLANDIKNLYYAQPDGYGGEIVPEGYKNHKEYREQLSKRYNLTKDELDDMVKTFGSDIYKESTARDKKLMQNYGKEHPVLGSLASFVGTLGGFGEGAVNAVSGLLTGDDRNLSHTFSNTKNSFREGAKKNIKSDAGKTAYDIGMGIGDMAVGAAAGSAPVVIAGNTANEAQESALKRGSSVRKSSVYGAGAGVLDFVTNKIGLDKAKKLAVDSIKSSGVKKFLTQNAIAGLGEAGENVLQDIGQSLLDLINGGNAELIQSYNDKISRGLSDTDAFKEVAKEYATQLATSGALGFGMGSAMQAGATIAPKIPALLSRKTPSEIPQGDVNNRVESPENLQPDMENVNRTMAESIGANNPRLVKKLEGDELKAAQKKVSDNNNAINALKNEIKVIENDPKNKHRGSLKKSVKADIEQRKAQIAELQNDNKATKRQINGEPTPVIEQLDADSVSRINSFKSEVRKIGNMWGGEGGKQLAKEVNDALDRYIESGSREDLVDFRDKLYTLHDSATGEYTSKNGNVSRYSDYYGDREFGIYEDLASGNSLLNKALREANNLRNAKQTTPDVETANNVPLENTTRNMPHVNGTMSNDGRTKTSRYYDSTMRNTPTNAEMDDAEYSARFNRDEYGYITSSHKETDARSNQFIQESGGEDAAIDRILNEELDGDENFDAVHIDAAEKLAEKVERQAKELEAQGQDATAQWMLANRLHKKIQENGTIHAKGLEILKKWKQSTPQGQVDYIVTEVNKSVDGHKTKGYTKMVNNMANDVEDAILNSPDKKSATENVKKAFAKNRGKSDYNTEKYEQLVLDLIGGEDFGMRSPASIAEEAGALIKSKMGVSSLTARQERAMIDLFEQASRYKENSRSYNECISRAMSILDSALPSSVGDKIRSVMYDNMLSSLKTMLTRNLGGNVLANAIETTSKPLQVLADIAASKVTKNRTRTLTGASIIEGARGFKKGVQDWYLDVKNGVDTTRSGQNSLEDSLRAVHKTFKTQSNNKAVKGLNTALGGYDRVVRKGMELGDRPVYEMRYAATKAELLDIVDRFGDEGLRKGLPEGRNISTDELIELIAVNEGLEAVLQNDSTMKEGAKALKKAIGKTSEDILGIDVATMSTTPFVEVPANMASRFFQFTPFGIVGNVVRSIKEKAKTGAVNQRRMTGEAGRNALGTLMAAGAMGLAGNGFISDPYSEDPDEKKLQQNNDYLEYALQTPDGESQIDLSDIPVLGPMLRYGKMQYDALQEGGIPELIGNIPNAAGSATIDTLYQGLNKLTGASNSYNSGESILSNAKNAVVSSIGSMINPALVRQTAQFLDPYKRDLGDYGTSEYNKNLIVNGLPILREMMLNPKVGTSGEPVKQNGGDISVGKFLNTYLAPWKVSSPKENMSDAQKYAEMLKEQTGGAVNPQPPVFNAKDLKGIKGYDKENYTHEDLYKIDNTLYKLNNDMAEKLINDPWYRSLSPEKQGKYLDELYSSGKEIVKENFVKDGMTPEEIEKADKDIYSADSKLSKILKEDDENLSGAIEYFHNVDGIENLEEKYGYKMDYDTYVKWNTEPDKKALGGAEKYAEVHDKANELGMNVENYLKKESEQPGGAVAYAQNKQAAKDNGFVDKDGDVDTKGYEKVISKAGTQSEKLINDLPALQQTGLEKSAYYTYANAINVIPSLTPSEFAQTYNEINTNKSNAMTQKELLAFLNMYQFSDDPAEDERIANEYWRAYGGWTNKAGVEKKIKFQNGQWKSYY